MKLSDAMQRLETAIERQRSTNERFRSEVSKLLYDSYTLGDGTEIKGQSMTHVRQCLCLQGWRGLSGYRLEERLEKAGFRVSRGRGLRHYRGGVRKLGVECDVVHQ